METDMRVWRYLFPPQLEEDGHEVMGSLPIWQPTEVTQHFLCDTGLQTILIIILI